MCTAQPLGASSVLVSILQLPALASVTKSSDCCNVVLRSKQVGKHIAEIRVDEVDVNVLLIMTRATQRH
jgi:hypothetical protein